MSPESIDSIKAVALISGFTIDESNTDATVLSCFKNNLKFKITVPFGVLEWFFDVQADGSDIESHDWFDYYGDSSKEVLSSEMEQDLIRLIRELPKYEYRLREQKSKAICERYEIDEQYKIGNWRYFYGNT